MIATTMATWMLLVRMQSPLHPEMNSQWNANWGPNATAEICESYARKAWNSYYSVFGDDVRDWEYTLTTTCVATTHEHEYRDFITCTPRGDCDIRHYKGPKE